MEDPKNHTNNKRVRDSDSDEFGLLDSLDVKKMREDLLLGILDDSDPDPETQELDSVIKSFEDEIISPAANSPAAGGGSQPELGYLLEASDDDLGIPPSSSTSTSVANCSGYGENKDCETELVRIGSIDSVGTCEFWDFENQISGYDDSFGLTINNSNNDNGFSDDSEYMAFDDVALFEYNDAVLGSSDASDFSFRLGSTSAE